MKKRSSPHRTALLQYLYGGISVFEKRARQKINVYVERRSGQSEFEEKKHSNFLQTHTKVLNLIANADVQPSYYRNIESNKRCVSGGKELILCICLDFFSSLNSIIECLPVNIFRDVCFV